MLKRIGGSVSALALLALSVLGAGTRTELLERAKDWGVFVNDTFGFLLPDSRFLIFCVAVLIGLWAWDVPQKLLERYRHRNDPGFETIAQQRRVRAEIRDYLRDLYDHTVRHAAGTLLGQTELAARAIFNAAEPDDRKLPILSHLLMEPWRYMNNAIQPVLALTHFETDAGRDDYLRAWGELFQRYQVAVQWLDSGYKASGIQPWHLPDVYGYERWRAYDAKFVEAMKNLAHMEGCEVIVPMLKVAEWGAEFRPERPTGLDRSRAVAEAEKRDGMSG